MPRHHRSWRQTPVIWMLTALALVASACGDDDDPVAIPVSGGSSTTPDTTAGSDASQSEGNGGEEIEVRAMDIAFDVDLIEVPVGEAVTVTFTNDDTDIPHNFHVEAGDVDAKTDIAPGPDTQSLEFTIDEAGTYTFICDVHPNMTGEVVAT